MPTVLRVVGYQLFFVSLDRSEPPHIHVKREKKVSCVIGRHGRVQHLYAVAALVQALGRQIGDLHVHIHLVDARRRRARVIGEVLQFRRQVLVSPVPGLQTRSKR